jgi:large subunit ribosomal protein L32e
MKDQDKKRLLRTRKKISQRRPHFKRFESWRFVRIKDQWRKPRGIDNKMRTEEKGWPKSVKIGYRGPSAVRGLHPSGYEEVMIWNTADLEKIDPETQVARIGGSVGRRKKETITKKAEKLKVKEDDFEELEDQKDDFEAEDELEDDDVEDYEE